MRKCQKPSLLVVATAIIFSTFSAQGQQTARGKSAEAATVNLLQMHSSFQQSSREQRPQLLTQFRAMAGQRRQLLSSLIQTNPADVLRIAIPNDIRSKMPAAVQPFIEQNVSTQGTIEISVEDSTATSKLHFGLNTAAGKLSLHFAGEEPTNLLTGSVVKVSGVQVGSAVALACCSTDSPTTVLTVSRVLPNTLGAQNTLVILANFQDNAAQPWTQAAAQSMVFTTASNFWLENSFQQTWITGDVAGWFTLPIASTTCNTSSIQSYAQQAAQNAGFNLSSYSHFVYMFPQVSACSWLGYSFIGGTPSNSWVNGTLDQQVVSHELGHALGLYHSHALSCGTAIYTASGCTQYEYGDAYETMGSSNFNGYSMHYNAFQKERLGWLNNASQPPITTVTNSGTYTLAPYESQDNNPKALKVLQSSNSSGNSYYYVEARQALGFDAILANPIPGYSNVLNGIVVRLATAGNANSSDILDMNPTASWGTAMALDLGQSYTDSTAGITITPTSVSSTGAAVQITLAGATCASANPTVSVSPSQSQYVTAGTAVSFTLTVTDQDSAGCAPATFNLSNTLPSGLSGTWNASTLSLSPGTSGTAILTVTSPVGTADGFYNVLVSAANASATSYSGSATATYVISTPVAPAPISVAVSTNQSSYLPGQTVAISVTMLSGTSADVGATVSVTVMSPNGKGTTLSGTTGSNGVATLNYKLSKRAASGTYNVQVSSRTIGSATASASTSFTVQ
jgi:Gametolysin peptidase M11